MTRLYSSVRQYNLKIKSLFLQDRLIVILCILFIGFLLGNLFGTILSTLRNLLVWDLVIVSILIVFMEIISYAAYKPVYLNRKIQSVQSTSSKQRSVSNKGNFEYPRPHKSDRKNIRPKVLKTKKFTQKDFFEFANFFKIGIMIGFFIDAFKVGS